MSRGHRIPIFRSLVAVVSFALAEGCRQQPAKPAPSSQPATPHAVNPILPAAPSGKPNSRVAQLPTGSGVDSQDAANSPACLPKTQSAAGWTKREPVRVYATANLAGAVSKEEAIRLGFFKIRSAAKCAYELKRSDGQPHLARVLLLETESADDAYGVLSCQIPPTETFKIGGETRVDRQNGLHLHCWQGKSYIRVDLAITDTETTEQVIRLLLNISGRIGRQDIPALLDAAPSDSAGLQRKWLVRHVAALPPKTFDLAFPLDVLKMGSLLGLDKTTLMCVAQYEVPQGARSNVVWVIRYATNKAAYDAHARYSKFLANKKDPAAQSTNLLPPHGQFLIGTWTAEEESMQYMMPRIGKLLPS